jgi:hypothetical protein
MEMGGMKARIKVQKSLNIYSTINKGWRRQWKIVGQQRRQINGGAIDGSV